MQSTFLANLQTYSDKIDNARAELATYEPVREFVHELTKEIRRDFGLPDVSEAAFPIDRPVPIADTEKLS